MPPSSTPNPVPDPDLPLTVSAAKNLAEELEKRVATLIGWYDVHSNPKARVSRSLRFLALILAIVGGLCPLLPESALKFWGWPAKEWGYSLLALAAGTLLFDKAFGVSSSWMRFKLTQVQLEAALHRYRIEVQLIVAAFPSATSLPAEAARRFTAVTRQFIDFAETAVVKETEIWILEFKSALLQIDTYIDQAQRAAKKT